MATNVVGAPASSSQVLGATPVAPGGETKAGDATADRFLKLLVAQMQNQDPLNPLDNAQVTSQMAQINTVAGLDRLNQTVLAMNSQFVQLQALQGAALVGREVLVGGDRLRVADGNGEGAFEIASAADAVKVEILGAGGQVIDRIDLGALGTGRHRFEWAAGRHGDDEGLRFRVAAASGGTAVGTQLLALDRVRAVSTSGDTLTLELQRGGTVPYSQVRSVQ